MIWFSSGVSMGALVLGESENAISLRAGGAYSLGLVRMLAIAIVLVLCASSGARAQDNSSGRPRRGSTGDDERPEPDQQRAARSLFDAGTIAFRQLRYEDALESFLQAYKLTDDPVLLFSIGMAYDRLYRLPEAVKAFEDYLRAMPDAPNRPAAEDRIRVIRAHIDQGEARQPTSAPPAGEPTPREPATPPASEPGSATPPPADSRGVRVMPPWAFWVGTGVTAALAGTAIWAGVDANNAYNAYKSDETEAKRKTGLDKQRRANIIIGTAAGAAVVTAIIGIFFTDWKGRAETSQARERLIWNAWLERDVTGVSLSRQF